MDRATAHILHCTFVQAEVNIIREPAILTHAQQITLTFDN